jgi:hypothetical protein
MMNYHDYVANVRFRFVNPHTASQRGHYWGSKLLEALGTTLEIFNTKLPLDDRDMKERLREICDIPRMSTFAIGAMINRGVAVMPGNQSFVNVGVWHGFTFLSGMVGNAEKKCVGIDNFSAFGGPREAFLARFNRYKSRNHFFHEMDYEAYFTKVHSGPIGFYVYDGAHGYQYQLKGLQLAEPFFSDNCVVLVDDTNWDDPRKGTLDFIARSPHSYKILLDETTCRNGHPTLWNGIMIIQRTG